MILNISNSQTTSINLNPQSKAEEIKQNLLNIINIYQGSVPCFRRFGFPIDCIDQPINLMQLQVTNVLIEQIELYEPRAKIQEAKVTQAKDSSGYLSIELKVYIEDE